MHLCLFEDDGVPALRPLVDTRAVYDLRLGLRSLIETTREALGTPPTSLHTRAALAAVTAGEHGLPVNTLPARGGVLFVNGRFVAAPGPVVERLQALARPGAPGRCLVQEDTLVAAWIPEAERGALAPDLLGREALTRAAFAALPAVPVSGAPLIGRLWDLINAIRPALQRDVEARAAALAAWDPAAADVQEGARLVRREAVHLAPGAVVRPGAILNATDGPVVIDRDAIVFENAVVRGPVYLGPHSQIRVGANIEGCAIGPSCKVGGEMHTCIFHSFSSKAHEGFLGDSYVGRWCNLGANSTGSNLKNNYGIVSLYNAATGAYEASGRQFLGQILADHSKCGINSSLNTGTVIGVFCNLYGARLHPRYVPAFTWGSADEGYTTYRIDKALDVARAVMKRRDRTLSDAERDLLADLFERTAAERAPAASTEARTGSNGAA